MRNGMHKEVLVAGGGGFLGSHLCDALLAQGARVTCIDNFLTGRRRNLRRLERESRFELVEIDVINPLPASLMRKGRAFDAVYNLACAASPPLYQADPEHTLLTSVLGTRHLLRLAERHDARFLLASTSEIYGDPHVHPQTEHYWGHVNPIGPRACYDEGKRAAETLTFDYARGGRGEVRVARIFNTYGPRLPAEDGRVVSNVISQVLNGQDVTVYGDGSQTRSFCYVNDTVEGLMRLMAHEGPLATPVNLGNPNEITINELVERVLELTRSGARVIRKPLPKDDPRRRRPDISLAQQLLGWEPRTELDQGLRATIDWYRMELEEGERSRQREHSMAGPLRARMLLAGS